MIADAVHEIERLRTEIERLRSELADWQRTVRALEAAAAEQGNIPEMNLEGEEWL
jgi:FtsZ-binding cell division protein ZapB